MSLTRVLPTWLTLGVLGAIVAGVLALVGWIKPYLQGPDLALTTIYRPKPVPVKVETVKWLSRVEVKREQVTVPIEVIREVPAKEEEHLHANFGIHLLDLKAENKELVDVLAVPRAPYGGEMALTANTATGKVDGIFRPNAAPFIEFGGIREAGLDYDPLQRRAHGYYRQDLVRVGPGVINGKVFA
ncbi:MAG TPA: hypothetical protein VEZ11_01170, partial [Thermoanaerobaculia bacterium]|nr:hypothetical protein [Thermoanaerobaculia bacterium]